MQRICCTVNRSKYSAKKDSNSNINPTVTNNPNCIVDDLLVGSCREFDKRASTKITKQMHNEFKDVFNGVLTLQVQEGSKLCQALTLTLFTFDIAQLLSIQTSIPFYKNHLQLIIHVYITIN